MTIFLREIKRNRKSFITWTASLAGANILMLLMFPYMDMKMDAMGDVLKQMPQGMLSALNLESMDFSKILPFFAYIFQYILLFSAIYAMQLGAGILSREESEKTIEFLLAKPVKRNYIVSSKIFCLLSCILIFNIIFVTADWLTIQAVTDQTYSFEAFMLLHLAQLLLQLFFAALGLLISVFVVKTGTILPLSIGIVLGLYFVDIASSITEKLSNLKYVTPFEYVTPADIIKSENIKPLYVIIMLAVITAAFAGSYISYNKKDIAC